MIKEQKKKVIVIRMNTGIKEKLYRIAEYYGFTDSGTIRFLISEQKI
jgi:antitoxin component of RelBE/YafQ-DinJ toxin-antitoxin module